jgi:hypothetical protein
MRALRNKTISEMDSKSEEPEKWSSPGGGKVTRAVQPWSTDYHTPVATMDTNKILRSTLTEETRTQKGDTKTCLL